MANDDKNARDLASSDADTTAELEQLTSDCAPPDDAEREAAADTWSFGGDSDQATRSVAELESSLRDRNDIIDRLRYDLEHLQSRWRGIETEMSAREEQVRKFNEQILTLQETVTRRDKLLKTRDETIKSLKAEIRDRHSRQEELQQRLDELRAERQQDAVESYQQEGADLTERMAAQDRRIEELENEKRSLAALLENDDNAEQRQTIARQQGQLASSKALVTELQAKFDRSEHYADSLRQRLQTSEAAAEGARAEAEHLQSSLDAALAEIETLRGEVEEQCTTSTELQRRLSDIQSAHAEEIRMIRFELGEAQETVAQHELVNEQLATDLIETRGYRSELETMLTETEQSNRTQIEKLELKNGKLEREIAELEGKLETKADAINCLLAELSKKSQQIESIGDIGDALQDIDERMTDRVGDAVQGDKDRITRVLVGSVEGQELRFPLFKDRLTIGRTEQNDIQLKAAYISRRHAVIVTEGDSTRVVDWGSKNGVFVNSKRISEHFLRNGDIIAIGTAKFRYEERPKRDA